MESKSHITRAADGHERTELTGLTDLVRIGQGGHATVYSAFHVALGQRVAVKCPHSPLVGGEQLRFDRECDALRRLGSHPNICSLIECRQCPDGHAAIVMEFHAGGSLADRISSTGPIAWDRALRIGVELAGALETSHRAGILHRDVNPSNILIGSNDEPILADFGLSRHGTRITHTGEVRATIEHAAPEVFAGRTPEPGADIYSLTSTLFELIAGHPPFAADRPTAMTLLARLASHIPPDLRDLGVPDDVCRLLEQGLSKEVQGRFSSAAEMAASLELSLQNHGFSMTPTPILKMGASGPTVPMSVPLVPHVESPKSVLNHSSKPRRRLLAVAASLAIGVTGIVVVSVDHSDDAIAAVAVIEVSDTAVDPPATAPPPPPPRDNDPARDQSDDNDGRGRRGAGGGGDGAGR